MTIFRDRQHPQASEQRQIAEVEDTLPLHFNTCSLIYQDHV